MKISSIGYYFKVLLKPRSISLMAFSFAWFVKDRLVAFSKVNQSPGAFIHPSVNLQEPGNVFLGKSTRVQPNVCLWASPNAKISIGDLSGIGPGTMIFSSSHKYEFNKTYIQQPWFEKDVIIEENVWIGAGCIITAGVTIGKGSVVGANSVVTRDIPPNSLAVGTPAKVIKSGS